MNLLYLQTGLALVILGVTLLWHVVAKKLGRLLEAADALNLALFFSFLIYPNITSMLFLSLGCKSFEDGRSYLAIDLSVDCADPAYLAMRQWSIAMMPIFAWPGSAVCVWRRLRRDEATDRAPARVYGRDAVHDA